MFEKLSDYLADGAQIAVDAATFSFEAENAEQAVFFGYLRAARWLCAGFAVACLAIAALLLALGMTVAYLYRNAPAALERGKDFWRELGTASAPRLAAIKSWLHDHAAVFSWSAQNSQ